MHLINIQYKIGLENKCEVLLLKFFSPLLINSVVSLECKIKVTEENIYFSKSYYRTNIYAKKE
jgi:hypothetical protein